MTKCSREEYVSDEDDEAMLPCGRGRTCEVGCIRETACILFEVLEKMSQDHPIRKIHIRDHKSITRHNIDKEFGDID